MAKTAVIITLKTNESTIQLSTKPNSTSQTCAPSAPQRPAVRDRCAPKSTKMTKTVGKEMNKRQSRWRKRVSHSLSLSSPSRRENVPGLRKSMLKWWWKHGGSQRDLGPWMAPYRTGLVPKIRRIAYYRLLKTHPKINRRSRKRRSRYQRR